MRCRHRYWNFLSRLYRTRKCTCSIGLISHCFRTSHFSRCQERIDQQSTGNSHNIKPPANVNVPQEVWSSTDYTLPLSVSLWNLHHIIWLAAYPTTTTTATRKSHICIFNYDKLLLCTLFEIFTFHRGPKIDVKCPVLLLCGRREHLKKKFSFFFFKSPNHWYKNLIPK